MSRKLILVLALIAVLFISVSAASKPKKNDRNKMMKCGICHVIVRNLENIKQNTKKMVNKGPYSMVTEVLIDESLKHVCGVSAQSFKTMDYTFEDMMEACYSLIWTHDQELEEMMESKEAHNPDTFCSQTIDVCAGIPTHKVPKPDARIDLPTHPQDVQKEPKPDLSEEDDSDESEDNL